MEFCIYLRIIAGRQKNVATIVFQNMFSYGEFVKWPILIVSNNNSQFCLPYMSKKQALYNWKEFCISDLVS